MSIQRRISILLLVIIVLFGAVSYSLLVSQLTPAFHSLEINEASTNIARVEGAMANDVKQLTLKNSDWATWDNTHQFIRGQDDTYVDENLDVDTFKQIDLDFVLFLDNRQNARWGMLFEHETGSRNVLDELDIDQATSDALNAHSSTLSTIEGIVSTRFGPLVVSSKPIVRNKNEGPIAGSLLFGQFLDAEHLDGLRTRTEVAFDFLPVDNAEFLQAKRDKKTELGNSRWQIETDNARIDYVLKADFSNRPLHVLRVSTPKDITALGVKTIVGSLFSLAILTLFVAVVIWELLRRVVVRPLTELTAHVTELQKTGDMNKRLSIDGNDELGKLASAFTDMQEALIEREKLVTQSVQELEHQAAHDTLTGLANRRALYENLTALNEQTDSKDTNYCVCILDLDRFKVVNDTSGHAAGDALLVEIANILTESVYSTDLVVRLGGDEFALVLFDCGGDIAFRICEHIREKLESLSFHWGRVRHRIGVSIGILSVSSADRDVSEILQRADAACFTAKESGRNRVCLAADNEPAVDAKRKELHWVQRLTTAIDRDQFLLFGQPIVPLQDERKDDPERIEVLVRLRNYSSKKLLPPGAFIPSAERYNLSAKVDQWVVTQVIKYTSAYEAVFGDDRTYWINLSGASLSDERFTQFLESAVENSQLPRGRLNFEITESTAIHNIGDVSTFMQRLRDLGCRFALDDFGAGFSSFDLLQSLPIDCLKIDGLIVRKIVNSRIDRMFVKSIIDIAHAMNIVIVAEFVEDDALANELTVLGADYGQGFALGRPTELMPIAVQAVADRSA